MARGSGIIVAPGVEPKGRFWEGIVNAGETFTPGVCVQIDPSQALQGGRHVCKLYNADADGGRPKGPIIIVLENSYIGGLITTTYAAGTRFFGYIPLPGDELNLLLGDVSGTGDAHTAGEILIIDDTTGEFIATTGSPEEEVAMLLESISAPTADTHAWCIWQR